MLIFYRPGAWEQYQIGYSYLLSSFSLEQLLILWVSMALEISMEVVNAQEIAPARILAYNL